ncbi:hypothetical protein AVEN_147812-1, partial [Araneus ventricosus]
LFWDRSRNFEPWSDDEGNTLADTPSPGFCATPVSEHLAPTNLTCTRPIYTTVLRWNSISNVKTFGSEAKTLPLGHRGPPYLAGERVT